MLPANAKLTHSLAVWCRHVNAAVVSLIALCFLLLPPAIVVKELCDPNVRGPGIPHSAWTIHQALSPRYEKWAKQRLASNRATELTTADISGTEWPLFGSAFYLWSTESLQQAWENDHSLSSVAPNVYARGAIDAAANLVIDPAQASWVKIHWGTNYLKTENVFYRMLVIAALTSHAKLTGDTNHLALLRDQADSLAAELDASPHGVLDDYPDQCYPGDVLTSIAMIRRADRVLGADHSAFVRRAIRGFQNKTLDPRGLVPYFSNARSGIPMDSTRGCGNSYVSTFAPEIWPDQAQKWYGLYSRYFWQERGTCAGFREFPNDMAGNDWYFDVDSGPVWGGFGCSACAFGVGAARANGHFEHAWPLTAEMLVASWPLPGGTCLLPRLLSNAADAPYLGESAILFNLTRLPGEGISVKTGGALPNFVLIFLAAQASAGLLLITGAGLSFRKWQKQRDSLCTPHAGWQVGLWAGFFAAGIVCLMRDNPLAAILFLLCCQFLPRWRPKPHVPPSIQQ